MWKGKPKMKIKKIQKINNLGTFSDFQWQDNCQEFGKYNFFYGWNYSGKTTLSRIFRCLEIKAQHSNFTDAEFSLETDNGNVTQRDISNDYPMRVFNEDKGPQPMVISQEFTLSMHEKANLRKFLESWRGKGFTEDEAKEFDITKLLGIPCMINIIHKEAKNGNIYANISNVSAMPKGVEAPAQINENIEFNFDEKFDEQFIDNLPDFIKDKIRSSQEYKALINPQEAEIQEEIEEKNDLPF